MKDKVAMLSAIKKEIALRKDYLIENGCFDKPILETLYLGGGTPTALSIDEIAGLLDTVAKYYTFVPNAEITIETNPDDLTNDYLYDLRLLGFNRLSIGVQSFFDNDLQWMNRRHCASEALQSIKNARKQGFHNINIDLIYGLPSMTTHRWKSNLKQAIALDVPHISAYHLTIEPKTVFGKRQAKGEVFTIPEDKSVRQFDTLIDALERADYEHYEISNFARSGFRSQHNAAYWRQMPYIGVGPSAHSYDGQSRQWNVGNNSQYIAALEEERKWFEREQLTVAEQYNDYVLVSLRAAWGADVNYIKTNFGDAFLNEFLRQAAIYVQNGYMRQLAGIFTLSRKGKMIADRIASDLFF